MLGKEKLVRHDLDTSAYGKRADDVVRLGWGVFGFGQGVLEGILNCYYFDPMGQIFKLFKIQNFDFTRN